MESTDQTRLTVTAKAYDALAERYTEFVCGSLAVLPLDRAFIGAFAELVRDGGIGPVADVGCGPGYLTAHLRDLGVDRVFGVDISAALIDRARRLYPGLPFSVGSMTDVDVADGTLAGIVAWYSVIHAPPADIPRYLAEFHRALAAGGHLLLAFFESEGGPVASFDHAVTPAYRWPVDDLGDLARDAGFQEVGRMLRKPLEGERFQRGHLLLRRL